MKAPPVWAIHQTQPGTELSTTVRAKREGGAEETLWHCHPIWVASRA